MATPILYGIAHERQAGALSDASRWEEVRADELGRRALELEQAGEFAHAQTLHFACRWLRVRAVKRQALADETRMKSAQEQSVRRP